MTERIKELNEIALKAFAKEIAKLKLCDKTFIGKIINDVCYGIAIEEKRRINLENPSTKND